MPTIDPTSTSSRKCCDRYMREYPTNMASNKHNIFCHHFGQNIANEKQKAKTADVCPDGILKAVCKSTPSTIGKSMPKSDNTIDGRGARMMRLSGVVIKVAVSWLAKMTDATLHFLNSNKIPATAHGTQPPTAVKCLKNRSK